VALKAARLPAACLTAAEAEEVASEALAQLVPCIAKAATIEDLKALAATIAHRRAISSARAKSAAKRGPGPWVLAGGSGDDIADRDNFATGTLGLSDLELGEMAVLLKRALDGLDPQTRLLIHAKTVDGLSYQELSAKHQMPLGTVCARVARGLKQIRRQLEESPTLMKELRDFLR
jgi:RNA polymerase sigma factor (sigma-70 family)